MKVNMSNKVISSMSIREELKERAEKAVEQGKFPGITSLSGLIEYALKRVLDEKEVSEVG